MPKQTKAQKEEALKQEAEAKRLEAEQKQDDQMRSRTAKYDQDLKERARKLSINPDNFETEAELTEAVKKMEGNNE